MKEGYRKPAANRVVTTSSKNKEEFLGKRSTAKKRAEAGQRKTVYLPIGLSKKVHAKCAEQERSLSDAVSVLLQQWVEGKIVDIR